MRRSLLGALAVLFAGVSVAQAQTPHLIRVVITYDDSSTETHDYLPGDPIQFGNITNFVDHINIWSLTSTDWIGRVSLSGSANTRINVVIGAASWFEGNPQFPFTVAGQDWSGLTAAGALRDGLHLEGHIGGNLTSDVSVGHLYRFDVDGGVNASISVTQDAEGFFDVRCGSVATGVTLSRRQVAPNVKVLPERATDRGSSAIGAPPQGRPRGSPRAAIVDG